MSRKKFSEWKKKGFFFNNHIYFNKSFEDALHTIPVKSENQWKFWIIIPHGIREWKKSFVWKIQSTLILYSGCIKDYSAQKIVHYDTSAIKLFLASDVITLVKKKFFVRVSYEILYHEVWKCGFPHAFRTIFVNFLWACYERYGYESCYVW